MNPKKGPSYLHNSKMYSCDGLGGIALNLLQDGKILIISDLKNPLWRIREKKCLIRIRISSQFALISAAIAHANTVFQKSFVYFNYMSFSKFTVKSNFSDLHLCSRIHLLA